VTRTVLVDTNVFTARLRDGSPLAVKYAKHVYRHRVAIAPQTVAEVRNKCRLVGHALHQRAHNADLWIAVTAIVWGISLVAHDAVFIGCPGLELRTELTR
jgi:predicted nucleic acid-binding protein